ncbi:hypothetical protein HYW74_02425 [Candidatus Pacearchaeota archaeon]|nr:hypothetical protein [Candidatus Pacearchaeota archaeon]
MKIILEIERLIKSNEYVIKDYKLIALFGSVLKDNKYDDIDLVTIGNNKNHNVFLKIIKDYFETKGFKVIFFKTIKKKPDVKDKKEMFIHDLHYPNINYLLEKEWKSPIIQIKLQSRVLYGSKKGIPLIKLKERDLYYPYYVWCKEVNNKINFDRFQDNLIKIVPFYYKEYSYIRLSNLGYTLLKILRGHSNWHEKRDRIMKVFLQNL